MAYITNHLGFFSSFLEKALKNLHFLFPHPASFSVHKGAALCPQDKEAFLWEVLIEMLAAHD